MLSSSAKTDGEPTPTRTDFSISYERPGSPQLFFLFVGIWNVLTIHTLDFVRATAIGDRNIVILKDPYVWHCFQRGVSDDYNSLDGIVRWQLEQLATRFRHVRGVFCVGTSAGAGAVIHTAHTVSAHERHGPLRGAWSNLRSPRSEIARRVSCTRRSSADPLSIT